jgi:hypothetical protein
MRDVVDGIRYLTHNGPVWRALPEDFPPAWTRLSGWSLRGLAVTAESSPGDSGGITGGPRGYGPRDVSAVLPRETARLLPR